MVRRGVSALVLCVGCLVLCWFTAVVLNVEHIETCDES